MGRAGTLSGPYYGPITGPPIPIPFPAPVSATNWSASCGVVLDGYYQQRDTPF